MCQFSFWIYCCYNTAKNYTLFRWSILRALWQRYIWCQKWDPCNNENKSPEQAARGTVRQAHGCDSAATSEQKQQHAEQEQQFAEFTTQQQELMRKQYERWGTIEKRQYHTDRAVEALQSDIASLKTVTQE